MASPPKETKQGRSKIKSATPKLDQNGNQKKWNQPGKNTTYYEYDLIMENGDTGKVNSTKQGNYTYPEGTEVTYTLNVYDGRAGDFYLIMDVKKVNDNFTGNTKSSYNNPVIVSKMAGSIALGHVISFFDQMNAAIPQEDMIYKYAKLFHDWIISKGTDRDICSNRWYSLEQAIKLVPQTWALSDGDNKTTQLLELAERLYQYVDGLSEESKESS